MKIIVNIAIETDGDFRVENADSYGLTGDGESLSGEFVFDDSTPLYIYEEHDYRKFGPKWRATALFKHMLCDMRVYFTHYWVLDDLYHLFNNAMKAINNNEKSYCDSLSGNYDGTMISFKVFD